MADILTRILSTKRQELAVALERIPLVELEAKLSGCLATSGFHRAVRGEGFPNVIAEVKKASPSAGVIRADFDPVLIAMAYQDHGASALSVLTDEHYFQGHLDYLRAVRATVQIPVLRKEFILDRYQLVEARVAGADAVLLIAESLPENLLKQLHDDALELGLDVLVELHDAEQIPRVLDCGATLVGINNRDLRKFETRLEHTLELRHRIPANITLVSESGIRTHADLLKLAEAGVHAVLVGESLIRSPDIGMALDALRTGSP
jgi:indole-3-glycerol phosphate synthase